MGRSGVSRQARAGPDPASLRFRALGAGGSIAAAKTRKAAAKGTNKGRHDFKEPILDEGPWPIPIEGRCGFGEDETGDREECEHGPPARVISKNCPGTLSSASQRACPSTAIIARVKRNQPSGREGEAFIGIVPPIRAATLVKRSRGAKPKMDLFGAIYRAVDHLSATKAAAAGRAGASVSVASALFFDPRDARAMAPVSPRWRLS